MLAQVEPVPIRLIGAIKKTAVYTVVHLASAPIPSQPGQIVPLSTILSRLLQFCPTCPQLVKDGNLFQTRVRTL